MKDKHAVFNFNSSYAIDRSFPGRLSFTAESAGVLRRALLYGSVLRDSKIPRLRVFYEIGWLHSESLDAEGFDWQHVMVNLILDEL